MPKGGRRVGAGNPLWKPGVSQDGKGNPRGAGRPPGSPNKKRSYAVVKAAYESGEPVPLEIMLDCMRYFHRKAGREATEADSEAALKEAGMWAQAAAPYMHARLQAIDARTTVNAGDTLTQLLEAIDGTSTGIADCAEPEEPKVEIKPPVLLQ